MSTAPEPAISLLLLLAEVAEDVRGLGWMGQGRCAETDPDSFFPEKGGSTLAAKIVCAGCEVREQCLAYALQHSGPEDVGSWGVWGGKSAQERQIMLGRRRKDAA
jgi:WhiB family redox-sensing transcriptional regulator